MPTLAILNFSLTEIAVLILKSFKISNSQINENTSRYQTKSPSLSEISFPNTPVKPARITARCNSKYVFFISSQFPVEGTGILKSKNVMNYEIDQPVIKNYRP